MRLGYVLKFSILICLSGYGGFWQSCKHIVQVEADSGVTVATHVGKTALTYNLSDAMSTYTEVRFNNYFILSH